jgi:cytochrome P450
MASRSNPEPAVRWDASLGGWSVTGYELVREGLRDPERFTSEGNPVAENLAGEAMLVDDSPVHDAVRTLWSGPFGPVAAAARRRDLEALADRLLAPVWEELQAGATIDLVPIFERFAGSLVLDLLKLERLEEDRFRGWYKLLLDSSAFSIGPGHPLHEARERAKAEVYELLDAELADRHGRLARREDAQDLVTLIARGEGGAGITRRVALDNLFNVLTGGADTAVRWLGNAVVLLHRNPDALRELRGDMALLPNALEEVMRLESVTRFAIRRVRADGVELAGQALARGDTVYFMTSLANRDPAVFEKPDRFDMHRRSRPHLGFSHGMHQCIGRHLARVEAQAMLGRLIEPGREFQIVEVDYGDPSVVRGPQKLLVCLAAPLRP